MAKPRVYVIDFKEPILKLRKTLANPDLPTVDLDVAMSLLFEAFEQDDIPQSIDKTVLSILEPGWLVENAAWDSEADEKRYNQIMFSALHTFAWEMYRLMEEHGLFHSPFAKYSYKRMINEYTLTFTQFA
jgi:hypothetical protein